MKPLLSTAEELHRIEVYSEYLRKIPELLKQLKTVENMYEKAEMEEKMLSDKDTNHSVTLYRERLNRIKSQCEERSADIREQLRLILDLKNQIEKESSVLQALLPPL